MKSSEAPRAVRRASRARHVKQVRPARAKARGAALTEAVLSAIILVPLLFGTVMIGKLVDIKQSAVQASRYAVWESTVHGIGAAPDDVHDRFFGPRVRGGSAPRGEADPGAATATAGASATDDAATETVFDATRVALGPGGAAARDYDEMEGAGTAKTVGDAVVEAGGILGGLSGGTWDLTANGLVKGGVNVPIERGGWLAGATLEETSVIMNDGWSAYGTPQLEERTKSFVPAGGLETIANTLSNVAVIPLLKELGGLDGALGKVDAHALPSTEMHTLRPYTETAE